MLITLNRIYEPVSESDGTRILVERLWPRGVSKERASIDFWSKDTAPSHELRKWFDHDPAKWDEFRARYFAELDANPIAVGALLETIGHCATFVFASKEERLNNAEALREYLLHAV